MTRAIIVLIFWLASGFGAYAQSDVKVIGVVTPGDCVQWFSATQIKDPGVTCNGGASTSPGGSNGQVQYNNAGTFGGLTNAQLTALINPAGSNGQVQYNNAGTFGGLTNTQLTALVQQFTSSLSGAVPASGGGTTKFLRADGSWVGLGTEIWVGNFGAVCDGVTDDTTAFQNAWNAAATAHKNLKVSGVGGECVITTLTMPAYIINGAAFPPYASFLVGDGPTSVILRSTVTGSNCAIIINGPVGAIQAGTMGGFALAQSTGGTGSGICLNQVSKLNINNIFVSGFNIGILASDVVELHLSNSEFYSNTIHVDGATSGLSFANAWNISDNLFADSAGDGILLINPAMVSIQNNTFEFNGQNTALLPASIVVNGLPRNGTFGVNIQGNYFEGGLLSEIALIAVAGDTVHTSHNISNNLFVRNSNTETTIIGLDNAATTANLMSVTINNNSFFDTPAFTAPGGTTYIVAANPLVLSYQVFCVGNTYNTVGQMPSVCQMPAPNAAWTMDTFGIFGGPH